MLTTRNPQQRRATEMLILATLFWGTSFPVMKAITLIQASLLPDGKSWFTAASMVVVRFGCAALIMLAWSWGSLVRITASEVSQGVGLGLCAGLGMLLQMDGLAYTSASTSAFLTQSYCVFLPAVAAWRQRRRPSGVLLSCSLLAMAGVAVLSNVDWRHFRLGRGELETLLGSIAFGGQILWLERPSFAGNRVNHFSLVMFATMALVGLPVALVTMQSPSDWLAGYRAPFVLAGTLFLVVFCTMIAFVLMNRWQPVLPAAEAGLIYAAEPVFASIFALFMPGWLSRMVGISYPNETATGHLLTGGGLITLANVLVQIRAGSSISSTDRTQKHDASGWAPPETFDSKTGQQ